jgi:hypothetical protein
MSKLLERLAMMKLKLHITSSPNFIALQSAYRSMHSTETAMVRVVNDILTHIDEGSLVTLISLDISAAFDTIDHNTLSDLLKTEFGLTGNALSWLSSYVGSRKCYAQVGQSRSKVIVCDSGVPQGSALSPLLFAAYVSPIGRLINSYDVMPHHQYADDTQVYIGLSADTLSDTGIVANCTEALQFWFMNNRMMLNPNKSEAMICGTWQRRSRSQPPSSVKVAGADIAVADHIRLLGVTVDLARAGSM